MGTYLDGDFHSLGFVEKFYGNAHVAHDGGRMRRIDEGDGERGERGGAVDTR